jgi:hypothetical protein
MLTPVARSSKHAVAAINPAFARISLSPLPPLPSRQVVLRSRRSTRSERAVFTLATKTSRRHLISEGSTTTPKDDEPSSTSALFSDSPFYLETGYSIFAKRPSRAFPPPFVSLPSGSFSDPLTTHNPVRGRRPFVNGVPVRGITNGDDAIIIGDHNFLAVNDGVGAWAQKERGHAALWSRLIAHFWAVEVEKTFVNGGKDVKLEDLNPIQNLQTAFEETKVATKGKADAMLEGEEIERNSSSPPDKKPQWKETGEAKDSSSNDILGTTTASSALLHYNSSTPEPTPVVLATTLGDCKVLIIRPSTSSVLYQSKEQWHWFDCPRQLGTNSPDTPVGNAVTDAVPVEADDLIAVLSDGVTDNLWEHEICSTLCDSIAKWTAGDAEAKDGIVYVARTLMNAAREIAQDPNAESPYMERALDEGLPAEGGKLDDISVLLGVVRKR